MYNADLNSGIKKPEELEEEIDSHFRAKNCLFFELNEPFCGQWKNPRCINCEYFKEIKHQ